MTKREVVLFVCVRNAGRSQIAEALFNRRASGRAEARSAGSAPAGEVHPVVVEALAEIGIDLGGAAPKGLSPEVTDGVTTLVTMGCGDACPVIPGAEVVDWELRDPADRPLAEVREIRHEIETLVDDLADRLGIART